MEGEEQSTKKGAVRSFRPGSAPKSSYRVKQPSNNDDSGQTPKPPKPKVTPRKSDQLVGSPPNLDAPIDFNSLQFEEEHERPQRRGIFDHVATPQRRPNPQPRLPKTPTNTNTNNSTDTSDPESAKKKRYRPRKKKTDDVSDESLTEEVSNMLLKASVDSFLNNNGNSNNNTNNNNVPRVVRVRNNSTGKDIDNNGNKASYNRVPPPASYEASSYPPTRGAFRTPQKSDGQQQQRTPRNDKTPQRTPQKTPQKSDGQQQQQRTPRQKTDNQEKQQRTPRNDKTPQKAPQKTPKEGGESVKKRRPRKKAPKKEGSEKTPKPQKTPQSSSKQRARDRFDPYIDSTQVQHGLQNKTLFQGVIRINAHNPREAYVTCEGLDKDVYIDGLVTRNRAFEGDIVIVQLYDKSKWKRVKKNDEEDDEEKEEDEEEKIAQQVANELFEDEEEHKVNKKLFSVENEKGIDSEEESHFETVKELEEEELDDEESDSESEDDDEDEESEEDKPVHPKEEMHKEQEKEEAIIKKQNEEALVSQMSHLHIKDTRQAVPSPAHIAKPKQTPSKAATEDELQPAGKVVFIVESKQNREIVGYVKPVNETGVRPEDRFASFVPMDVKLPRMIIPIGQIPDFYKESESYSSKLVIAELLDWKSYSYLPMGKYKGVLGESGDILPETEAILIQHRIDASDFPAEVLDSIPKESYKISQEEINRRRDLRDYRIFTVDPATAKDLDDALHITPLSDGNFEVGVHIADVSFFVKPGTKLDEIAKERSTSVYFVQKVIPMLPNVLCENLCSLNPGVDRLAFSVIWKLTPQGEILSEWFGRTVIRSCSKMTYDVAQYMIEGKIKESFKEMHVDQQFKNLGPMGPHTVPQIVQDVLNMHKIAANMRRYRFKNGALSMNNVKLSFKLNEFGNPVSYAPYITREANHMIEEYMLLANQQVAARIAKEFPITALLRNHTNPMLRKLDTFVKFCAKNLGVPIDSSNAKSLGQSLDSLGKTQSPQVFAALRILATRSMQLAKYFCTGNMKREEWRHYALNVETYTHFTSPIRRYPDVVVHRQLQAALTNELELNNQKIVFEHEQLFTQQELTKISTNANDKKLLSRKAQEDSMKLYLCVFLKNNPVVEDAVVLSIGEKYLSVILTSLGFEKRIFIEDLVLNGFKVEDSKIFLFWPTIPGEITKDNVEQVIKNLSLVRVKVSTKLVRGRPELHLMLLHPKEAQGVLELAAAEPPKVSSSEIPTAEYFAEDMD